MRSTPERGAKRVGGGLGVVPLALAVLAAGCSDGPTTPGGEVERTTFPTLEEIIDEMMRAASDFPAIARTIDLTARYGTPPTHEGRSLYAVKVSDNVGMEEDEPTVLIVAAHHANEIGTPVVALDALARLTGGYGSDATISSLVDGLEIWIAPIWNPDGYPTSRKNGRVGGGVDLNRNYPFLWSSACSGNTNPTSPTYKGAAPGSEPETQTMMAFSEDQRFTKVLDFHSAGREVVYGYRCSPHALLGYLQAEAAGLSQASSYGGVNRPPSAEGEHYHWQLGTYSNYAFLTEIDQTQSPGYAGAVVEADRLWPGTIWMLQRPIPVRGHVTDAASGAPLSASIRYVENPFTQGERNTSEPLFGRYHAFLPLGDHTLRFEHPSYVTQELVVRRWR